MKANKNLKFSRRGNDPLNADSDSTKNGKQPKDKSAKRRLSIYDDFNDEENLDDVDYKYIENEFDEE